ncbi:SDR family NAD(P)-dependent oxidoreductase [Romeria aff. gracilis LEGE 07310]|uniref:SDR family NAD(P)-dependent oxidoreductase n=1 Tax=Vasconcelosia minhoensis LEGE 07310 TaxID=915328 RepID=A0A8J7A654_9CYAN|nr:SDR family NAD(P)-dependent oxidoreductase [Romeria gracilis]MBE9077342.1 SDR family NAD(P)-dependent oxidoreductase [Romeria aff. gracilis LEGE 07310]
MTTSTKIHSNSVILVSGGARGVTAQCVIELARQYRCRFVLLGRSAMAEPEPAWAEGCCEEAELKRQIMQALLAQGEKPKPAAVEQRYRQIVGQREIIATLSAIQQVGGQAEYMSADITDEAALQQAVTGAIAGPITGLIHGAGALADKRIEHKTDSDFERVYNTKVTGLNNLLSCVDPSQLDFLVLFSSFVGFYGNAGQADYALANEILNKTAHRLQRRYPSCHVVAVGWGPWDGGMVTAELKRHFAQLEMALIPPAYGAQLLAAELAESSPAATQLTVMSRPIELPAGGPYGQGHRHRVRRQLTLATNPFVREHVIGSQPVLPAMCGLSWIANGGEQLYPGYRFTGARDFKVLKGIVFDRTLAPAYTLELTERQADETTVTLEAGVWSEGTRGLQRYHYRTELMLTRTPSALETGARSHPPAPPTALYQDGTLFHQPGFQSLRTLLEISEKSLVVQCHLPTLSRLQQGQFPVRTFNPYTADAFYQCLLAWVRKQRDLGSLPSQFGHMQQLQPLSFDQTFTISLEILAEDESTVTAHGTAHRADGTLCMQVEAMQVVKSARLKSLFLENVCSESVPETDSERAVALAS